MFETLYTVIEQYALIVFHVLFSEKTLYVYALFGIFVIYDVVRKGWANSFTHKFVTGSAATVGIMAANALFVPFVIVATGWLQQSYQSLGIPHLPVSVWENVPIWLAAIIALFAYDFADYWNHRLMHTRWLFPIHAMHHSDQEVNVLTTYRVHIFEVLFMRLGYVVFLSWLGFPPEVVGIGSLLLVIHNAYVHADLDWDHGPFKYLIASPRFHRWHHANDERVFGKNLANLVPGYDYIFGTYFDPHPCRSPMGADGVPHSDVVKLMLYPFAEWSNLISRHFKKHEREGEPEERFSGPAE